MATRSPGSTPASIRPRASRVAVVSHWSKVSDEPFTTVYAVSSPKAWAMAWSCSGGSCRGALTAVLRAYFLLPSSGWAGMPTGWRCCPSTSWKCSATWVGVHPPSCHMVATWRGVWKTV